MINDALLSQFTLLLKAAVPPLQRVSYSTQAEPKWTPGQKLSAVVLASLPNDRFEVRVDDQVLELNLPKNTQPGDQLDLVYVGPAPRLTFALQTTQPPASSELSETAHMLSQQMQKMAAAPTPALRATQPVLQAPPTAAPELAQGLKQALEQSGVFYESHQAEWVQGLRPLAVLQQEPQAALLPQASQNAPALAAPATVAGPPGTMPHPADEATSSLSVPQSATANGPGPISQSAGAAAASSLLPANNGGPMDATLQQQLQMLETGVFRWSGAAWPGQQMDWEIASLPDPDGVEYRQWQTRLDLTLPALGPVSAWLLLNQNGLQVRLAAENDPTIPLLDQATTRLGEALQAAGLNLLQMTVSGYEKE